MLLISLWSIFSIIIITIRYLGKRNLHCKKQNIFMLKHWKKLFVAEFILSAVVGFFEPSALIWVCSILMLYVMVHFDGSAYSLNDHHKKWIFPVIIVMLYLIIAELADNSELFKTNLIYVRVILVSALIWLVIIIKLIQEFIRNIKIYEIKYLLVNLFFIFIAIISVFALLYEMGYVFWDDFIVNKDLSWIDMVYFSVTVFTSTGFGDITPNSHFAKVVSILEMISGMIFNSGFVAILVSQFLDRIKCDNGEQKIQTGEIVQIEKNVAILSNEKS